MKFKFSTLRQFVAKVMFLARPYGRKKLLFVFIVMLAQGIFQVIGVTSVFPFLAVASDPSAFRQSSIGQQLLSYVPDVTDQNLLFVAGIFALLMLFFSNALMLFGEVVRTRYIHGFGHWLRLRLLNRMLSNPYGYFLMRNTGILLKKTTGDVMVYISGVLAPLMEATARLMTVGFLLLTLVLIDPFLALITTVVFGTFYIAVFSFLKHRRAAASKALNIANRGAMREAQQLLGGIKPVKVHGAEQVFLSRYAGHSQVQSSLQKWFPIYQNAPRYLIEPLAFGGIVILVMFLSAKGDDLTSFLPTLGMMALAGYRLIPNFQLLYGAATGMGLMVHSLDEVYEEFKEAEGVGKEYKFVQEPEGIQWTDSLQLKDIWFSYEGAPAPIFDQLSIEVRKNQFVAFIGETGSGKSTLIDIILGLHWPQGGTILLDGKPLTQEGLRKWRAGIGYVPQEIFLLDDTIAANIAFGIDETSIDMEQVERVAQVAQIHNFITEELPGGYQSQVGERGVRLSGGQRQRIGLARALYRKPSLLVLDEATSALDTATETALMEAIEGLYGQISLIVIAHRLTTVRKADRIYRLRHGKVVESGTFTELKLDKEALG